MSYPVTNFINITTRISAAGLSAANFGSAMLFVPASDVSGEKQTSMVDNYKTYYNIQSVAEDFEETTEAYKLASVWLGGAPALPSLMIWVVNDDDESVAATLNKARNKVWWYWTFFTKPTYEQPSEVQAIAQWCDQNNSYFMDCQSGTSATAIRTETTDDDIASTLTTLGVRHCTTAAHASDAYAGVYLAKHFAVVNYQTQNSTITGEYKKSSGLEAENIPDSEYAAMIKDTKKCAFYTVVELQGSTDSGRWINTRSHSTYGEWMDDVINLDAFVNALCVNIYNAIANQPDKLPQTPVGQSIIIGAAKETGEQFIKNRYLGERTYIDPDDGKEKTSRGYEILTKPEDILDLSDTDRNNRKAAPLNMRVFRAGAIHGVNVQVDVY